MGCLRPGCQAPMLFAGGFQRGHRTEDRQFRVHLSSRAERIVTGNTDLSNGLSECGSMEHSFSPATSLRPAVLAIASLAGSLAVALIGFMSLHPSASDATRFLVYIVAYNALPGLLLVQLLLPSLR